MKENDLLNKIINYSHSKKKYPELENLLFQNYDTIINAIKLNISIKTIAEVLLKESEINVSLSYIYKKIQKIKDNYNNNINQSNMINNNPIKLDSNNNLNNESNEPQIIKTENKKFIYNNNK